MTSTDRRPSIVGFAGLDEEHNFAHKSPPTLAPPKPAPVAEPAPAPKLTAPVVLPSAEIKVDVRRQNQATAKAKPAVEPQLGFSLSAQIASEYQHEDERTDSTAARRALAAAAKPAPAAQPAAAAAPKPAAPVLLPSTQLKVGNAPAKPAPAGPQTGFSLSSQLASEYELAPDDSPVFARIRADSASEPAAAPEAFPVSEEKPTVVAVSVAVDSGGAAAPAPRASKPAAKDAEPQQWTGLASGMDSAVHNMMPSPETSGQRRRRISREVLQNEKAAEERAQEENAKQDAKRFEEECHAKPAHPAAGDKGAGAYFDFSPLSLMGS